MQTILKTAVYWTKTK